MDTRAIPISHVYFDSSRRALSRPAVKRLATSIGEIGLINPITVVQVGEAFNLVAGLHRFKAAEQLGWTEIRANVVDLEKTDQQLTELDENIVRHDLRAAQRARLIGERERIYLLQHPEAKHGGAPGKSGGGKKAKDVTVTSFADDTAKKTGRSSRAVARDTQIANAIPTDVFEAIADSAVADSQTDLLALARLSEEDQRAVVVEADLTDKASIRETIAAHQTEKPDTAPPAPKPKAEPAVYTTEIQTTVDAFARAAISLFTAAECRQIIALIEEAL